jgi:hypothetical protein
MKQTTSRTKRFRVGDWVSFLYGPRRAWAQIIEDRGPIGVGRRRLYRLRLDQEGSESRAFEMPEVDLQLARPDPSAVVQFLKEGGLVTLLREHAGATVWLTFNAQGQVMPTFTAERGLVGGKAIPFLALDGDRVFSPRQEEVLALLESFGLTEQEGAEVIAAVGTAP